MDRMAFTCPESLSSLMTAGSIALTAIALAIVLAHVAKFLYWLNHRRQ